MAYGLGLLGASRILGGAATAAPEREDGEFDPATTPPVFFEMVEQDRLLANVWEAAEFLGRVLVRQERSTSDSSLPSIRGHLRASLRHLGTNWGASCVVLLAAIEGASLLAFDASFSENYFGLRRVRRMKDSKRDCTTVAAECYTSNISRLLVAVSLLTVFPYARRRLAQAHHGALTRAPPAAVRSWQWIGENWKKTVSIRIARLMKHLESSRRISIPETISRWTESCSKRSIHWTELVAATENNSHVAWHKFLVKGVPWCHGLWETIRTFYKVMYLIDRDKYRWWSPELHLMGVFLTRRGIQHPPPWQDEKWFQWIFRLAVNPLAGLTWSLVAIVHVLRFVEWWYENERLLRPSEFASKSSKIVSRPPRPPPLAVDSNYIPKEMATTPFCFLPTDPQICAVCQHKRVDPAASTSGAVFCFGCLVSFVETYNRCPLTGIACEVDQVRRLYYEVEKKCSVAPHKW